MNQRRPVSIFGATGQVGRHLAAMLSTHPRFSIGQLVGSPSSVGRDYPAVWGEKETTLTTHYGEWYPALPYPESIPSQVVVGLSDIPDGALVVSSVPERAGPDEDRLAAQKCTIISNSPYRRMDPALTLAIPGIPSTLVGNYVKIPNCATIGIALALYPISHLLKTLPLSVSTYQSLSGRGDARYPKNLAIGNVFPLRHSSEDTEARIQGELRRILPDLTVSVSCYRTPTPVGHLIDVSLFHQGRLSIDTVITQWMTHIAQGNSCGIYLTHADQHPQSLPDSSIDQGMTVVIGNIADHQDAGIIRFTVVVNNLIRGAAGSLILALDSVGNST